MLPEVIPLFPLPDVVFFPRMVLPLHIFEPRYRAMVRDAMAGSRVIGMVCLREGWEANYGGRPAIFPIGTAGEMVRMSELPDGRFNIILRGVAAFDVVREGEREVPYREATISERSLERDALAPGMRTVIGDLVQRWLARSRRPVPSREVAALDVDDETFVNFFGQHLELPALDKQALLEERRLSQRAQRLCDVLEFALGELNTPGGITPGGRLH